MKNVFLVALAALLFFSGAALAKININTASQEQLAELSGIGPAKAAAIVKYREANGDFASVAELDDVEGIGAGTLESLKGEATIEAAE